MAMLMLVFSKDIFIVAAVELGFFFCQIKFIFNNPQSVISMDLCNDHREAERKMFGQK